MIGGCNGCLNNVVISVDIACGNIGFIVAVGSHNYYAQRYDDRYKQDDRSRKYYRKAEELRNEKRNQELWLQGMYIYEALCDVSPILHAFAKKGTKPTPYSAKPYSLTEQQVKRDEEEKQRKLQEKGKRFMEAIAVSVNKKFEGKTQEQK